MRGNFPARKRYHTKCRILRVAARSLGIHPNTNGHDFIRRIKC